MKYRKIFPWEKIFSHKWIGLRIAVSLCAALGWWGLLYPELTLTPDTVTVSEESAKGESGRKTRNWCFDDNLYLDLLNADRDQITFRSRLLTDIGSLWEALHERNEQQDQSK